MSASIGLYLHFPFCKQKCSYCDFNSYSGLEALIPEYIEALSEEIKRYLPCEQPVHSVYFGGGTPTLVPALVLCRVLKFIKGNFRILPQAEISIEANPGTIDLKDLAQLVEGGFNRLSIGGQAVQDRLLQGIGRIHCRGEIFQALKFAREAGFSNVNLDLMFGLPGQSVADWRETLEEVVAWGPQHVSAYGLQVEEGTLLTCWIDEGRSQLPPEEETVAMMALVMDYLPKQGYGHYEISNYAQDGYLCRHNLGYWAGEPYLGFGAGATSTRADERWTNLASPVEYIEGLKNRQSIVGFRERIDRQTQLMEALMLGLRLRSGLDLTRVRAAFDLDLQRLCHEEILWLTGQNLLEVRENHLSLTTRGIFLANQVIGTLVKNI